MAEYSFSASVRFRAIAPALSSVRAMGIIPSADNVPAGGFNPQIPLNIAQAVTEWDVSVPTAIGTIPAATATADPEEEPVGESFGFTA